MESAIFFRYHIEREAHMTKNICTMEVAVPPQDSALSKASGLLAKIWSGADRCVSTPQEARRPGPVLHRLPDLRKFGPNFV
jgi:hypothetical protein